MKLRALRVPIMLDESQANSIQVPSDVQLMRTGKFNYNGKDLEITSDILESMIMNFNDQIRGIDLAIDYKHESDDIAAGWIKKVYIKNGNELWANVNWTPNGRKVLSEKEFRYLSADFMLNYVGNENNKEYGPTLLGAGLTNRPFIKEMDPVVELSELKGNETMDPKDKQIADLQKQIEEMKAQLGKDVADDNDGSEVEASDSPKSMADMKKQLADMQKENDDMKQKCASYAASAAKAEEEKKMSEKKSHFDKLLSQGKVVEAQREAFLSNDMIKFSENSAKLNLDGSGSTVDAPVATDATEAQDAIIKLAEKKLRDKEVTSINEGIALALKENKSLVEKIYI